jgi:hypothetical protein
VTVAVECVLVTPSCGVPLRGLGFGLSVSGPAWAGSYRSSADTGRCSGVRAMACTNRLGWPGNRWGRPDWTTTGVIRPVTEIARSIVITVDDLAGLWTYQVLVDAPRAEQPARGAVR